MDLEIRALAPELAPDYFDFFESRAFTDDSPYRCYCQMFQASKAEAEAAYSGLASEELGRAARREAERQIRGGRLRGYLAYAGGQAIGWCNACDRANLPEDPCVGPCRHAPKEARIKAVLCFEIAPEWRGRGVATALLARAITDAAAEGYAGGRGVSPDARGALRVGLRRPVRLYEKAGFQQIAQGRTESWCCAKRCEAKREPLAPWGGLAKPFPRFGALCAPLAWF